MLALSFTYGSPRNVARDINVKDEEHRKSDMV